MRAVCKNVLQTTINALSTLLINFDKYVTIKTANSINGNVTVMLQVTNTITTVLQCQWIQVLVYQTSHQSVTILDNLAYHSSSGCNLTPMPTAFFHWYLDRKCPNTVKCNSSKVQLSRTSTVAKTIPNWLFITVLYL